MKIKDRGSMPKKWYTNDTKMKIGQEGQKYTTQAVQQQHKPSSR